MSELPEGLRAEVMDLYRHFGGQSEPLLRPGAWDLSFTGNLVIELDEELHFNRYRAVSLSTSWSKPLPWTAEYQKLCERHEAECRSAGSWGKRWSNASCARMFGDGGPPGDLSGAGAPRWKQRALYDSLKDLVTTLDNDISLARVSVYDLVENTTLGSIVEERSTVNPKNLRAFVEARTS
jgi:hypothetical protein